MLKYLAIFGLIIATHVVMSDDIPDECRHPPMKKAPPMMCCDVPELMKEQDAADCGFTPPPAGPPPHPRPPGPPPCDKDICILKKYNLISGEDKVDKDAMKAFIEQISSDNPAFAPLVQTIKERCLDSDLANVGHPGDCEPRKINKCVFMTTMTECPKWKETDECGEMKQHIEKCKQFWKKPE